MGASIPRIEPSDASPVAPIIWVHFYKPIDYIGLATKILTISSLTHCTLEVGPGALYHLPFHEVGRWYPASDYHKQRKPSTTLGFRCAPDLDRLTALGHEQRFDVKGSLWAHTGIRPGWPVNCVSLTATMLEASGVDLEMKYPRSVDRFFNLLLLKADTCEEPSSLA